MDPARYLPPPAAANPIPTDEPVPVPFTVGDHVEHADTDGYITGTVVAVLDSGYVKVAWNDTDIHSDQLIPGIS